MSETESGPQALVRNKRKVTRKFSVTWPCLASVCVCVVCVSVAFMKDGQTVTLASFSQDRNSFLMEDEELTKCFFF